jgi:hypothetical protein
MSSQRFSKLERAYFCDSSDAAPTLPLKLKEFSLYLNHSGSQPLPSSTQQPYGADIPFCSPVTVAYPQALPFLCLLRTSDPL